MKKKKIKKVFLIPLFIGIGLIVGGIVTLITTATSMSMSNTVFLTPAFFAVGGFMIMFVTPLVFMLTNRKNLTIDQNGKDISDSFKDLVTSIKKLKEKECKYCGAILKLEDTNCPNCGAKDVD